MPAAFLNVEFRTNGGEWPLQHLSMDVRPEFESTRYQTWSYTSYDHRMTAIARAMNIPLFDLESS